jgi:hypothetical protein
LKKKNDSTFQEALQEMLKEYKLSSHLKETKIKMLWESLMGKTIATYTSNIQVRKNVLYLSILSAPLRQELSFSKEKIITLLNGELGEDYIKEVVIR